MTAVLTGLFPGIQLPGAYAAIPPDACGNLFGDYLGTYTGTVLQGDGPETLTYTMVGSGGPFYSVTLTVSDTTGQYQTQGDAKILGVNAVGSLMIKVPVWHNDNRVTYEDVTTNNTQCLPGTTLTTQPTSFTIRPMDGAEIIMMLQ
ncbi:hypothetical protein [Streptomyces sp. NPDC047968]|uniref:hypothetical protein n=1 Tax=unclassified Streptomyces TaxID=2593676 RepID=UPI0034470F2C